MTLRTRKRDKKKGAPTLTSLPTIQPMVGGIDVGSTEHWVCGPASADGKPNVRVFGTTTDQLQELADWLIEQRVE